MKIITRNEEEDIEAFPQISQRSVTCSVSWILMFTRCPQAGKDHVRPLAMLPSPAASSQCICRDSSPWPGPVRPLPSLTGRAGGRCLAKVGPCLCLCSSRLGLALHLFCSLNQCFLGWTVPLSLQPRVHPRVKTIVASLFLSTSSVLTVPLMQWGYGCGGLEAMSKVAQQVDCRIVI